MLIVRENHLLHQGSVPPIGSKPAPSQLLEKKKRKSLLQTKKVIFPLANRTAYHIDFSIRPAFAFSGPREPQYYTTRGTQGILSLYRTPSSSTAGPGRSGVQSCHGCPRLAEGGAYIDREGT